MGRLRTRLFGASIPTSLMHQYLPDLEGETADELVLAALERVLRRYQQACARGR